MIDAIRDRLQLVGLNIVNSYRVQTAYFFENWSSFLSTGFYTLSMLLFIKVIYSNVKLFAGYSETEMLFLILLSQLSFYTDWLWSTNNITSMIDSVRTGELDLILSKPLPSLFYITFREISLINRVKDGLPNIILIALLLNWSQIHTSLDKVVVGVLIFFCGQVAWHCFRFIFALPVFFMGQSTQIFQISGTLTNTNNIPFEGFAGSLKTLFVSCVPVLITAQMSVSVMLGKSNSLHMLILATAVAGVFLILKQIGWIIALRNYSSASS
jgi:ABC-2 type transport system permease protein